MLRIRRIAGLILAVWIVSAFSTFTPAAVAAPQYLQDLSYRFYPLKDLVFVDLYNPYFNPVDSVIVNMTIREGVGENRVVAIGQVRLPENMVLMPGEHTSARVPIRARVVKDIPPLAVFEFRISGRQMATEEIPPDVVVQDSSNGVTIDVNRDASGIPYVMGFIELNRSTSQDTTANVEMAILTFLDQDHQVVWSEVLPVNGTLAAHESLMVWSKYDQLTPDLVPDIEAVEAKFVVSKGDATGR